MIPINEPFFGGREKELLMQCIDTGWVSSEGPFVLEFEELFSKYIGCTDGVSVTNGTSALETALYSTGVGKGDEVILPAFTIISCAIAIIRVGAKPVLVDCIDTNWSMDISEIERKITPATKAIMAVHMYGHPLDMDLIMELANKNDLIVLEDAAQVHGAEYKGKKVGSIGHVSAFSFYANKNITTGEGGMVVTSDPRIAKRARSYRDLFFNPQQRFLHDEIGYNFRMSNIQAALGVAQMEQIETVVAKKRELGQHYYQRLASIRGLRLQEEMPWGKHVYWMYCVELDPLLGINASQAMDQLRKKGIATRPFFIGLHQQPAFNKHGLFLGEEYPRTEQASRQGFYLPSGVNLNIKQLDYICDSLKVILKAL